MAVGWFQINCVKKSLFHHFHPFKVVLHFQKCFVCETNCSSFADCHLRIQCPDPMRSLGSAIAIVWFYFGVDSTLLFRRMGPLVKLPTKKLVKIGGQFRKSWWPSILAQTVLWTKELARFPSWGFPSSWEVCVKNPMEIGGWSSSGVCVKWVGIDFYSICFAFLFFVFGWLCEKLAFATSNSTISLKSLWPWDQDLTISRVQVLSAATCHLYLHLLLLTELYMRLFFCTKICSVKQISFQGSWCRESTFEDIQFE